MRIAIIGSGISGLGAAYLLNPIHDITVYEKNDYVGGHSRTIDIPIHGKSVPVDTGFIVYNDRNYPLLNALFHDIGVEGYKTDMSFGVSINNGFLEYSSNNIFGNLTNVLRPKFIAMVADILKFNKEAKKFIDADPTITLGDCLDKLKLGSWFENYYILAMGAAIWSCSIETIRSFPARTFIKFFDNHGLLSINDRPTWYTVKGGSRAYVEKLTQSFKEKIKLGHAVTNVTRNELGVIVSDSQGGKEKYDHVIFASHADQSMALLGDIDRTEAQILSNFTYQKNTIIVHSDQSFMPKKKKNWSSWVYLNEKLNDEKEIVSLSYWMNSLQDLECDKDIFVTLNPERMPKAELVYDRHSFEHPVFDIKAVSNQLTLNDIQGHKNCWYAGAFTRYGFHEDGLMSGVAVAQKLGAKHQWQ
jgi:predicted NAD/FAD-binding protein